MTEKEKELIKFLAPICFGLGVYVYELAFDKAIIATGSMLAISVVVCVSRKTVFGIQIKTAHSSIWRRH